MFRKGDSGESGPLADGYLGEIGFDIRFVLHRAAAFMSINLKNRMFSWVQMELRYGYPTEL